MKARVFVTLKPGVLDPQGKAIHHALEGLGFSGVQDVRAGKLIELAFEVPADNCTMQRLSLETDAKTDSWRDRYRGEATFHALRINRL